MYMSVLFFRSFPPNGRKKRKKYLQQKPHIHTVDCLFGVFISFYFFLFFVFVRNNSLLYIYIAGIFTLTMNVVSSLLSFNSFILLLLLEMKYIHREHRTRFGTFRCDFWWILIWTFVVFQLLYRVFLIIAYEIHLVFWWKRNSFRVHDGKVLMHKLRLWPSGVAIPE